MPIRPFVAADVPQVADLHRTVFKTDGRADSGLDSYRGYFTRVFLDTPAQDAEIPSLVYEQHRWQHRGLHRRGSPPDDDQRPASSSCHQLAVHRQSVVPRRLRRGRARQGVSRRASGLVHLRRGQRRLEKDLGRPRRHDIAVAQHALDPAAAADAIRAVLPARAQRHGSSGHRGGSAGQAHRRPCGPACSRAPVSADAHAITPGRAVRDGVSLAPRGVRGHREPSHGIRREDLSMVDRSGASGGKAAAGFALRSCGRRIPSWAGTSFTSPTIGRPMSCRSQQIREPYRTCSIISSPTPRPRARSRRPGAWSRDSWSRSPTSTVCFI